MIEPPLLRIGELNRRLGVSEHVLRAWERRYGLLHGSALPQTELPDDHGTQAIVHAGRQRHAVPRSQGHAEIGEPAGVDPTAGRGASGVAGEPAGMFDHPDAALVPAAPWPINTSGAGAHPCGGSHNTPGRDGLAERHDMIVRRRVNDVIVKPLDVRLHHPIAAARDWRQIRSSCG